MKLKKVILKITAAFFTYCFCIQSVTATESYSVQFTKYTQQKSNWCWVASAECSGKHLRYTTRTGGHATPVHMVYKSNDNVQSIAYYDPQTNKSYYMTYAEFCDSSRNGRIFDHTCIVNE